MYLFTSDLTFKPNWFAKFRFGNFDFEDGVCSTEPIEADNVTKKM